MTFVVFSKDRAMQLEAFLRSFQDHVTPLSKVYVLFTTTSPRHLDAYCEVFNLYEWAVPVEQRQLKEDVLGVLPEFGTVAFFVDDQVFIRPWRQLEYHGLSLRLAPHLSHCYTLDVEQPVPPLYAGPGSLLSWNWSDGQYDWGYPLSLDGHVFASVFMRHWITALDFNSPNAFESQLQRFTQEFEHGFCYEHSRVVNIPCNRVQQGYPNRVGTQHSVDAMLEAWEAGLHIDTRALYGVVNKSVHQELPLTLVAR